MASKNETVSHQNLWVGNIVKFMMSEGNSAQLPANVDPQLPLQQDLMNSSYKISSYKTNPFKTGPLGNIENHGKQITVSLGISHL